MANDTLKTKLVGEGGGKVTREISNPPNPNKPPLPTNISQFFSNLIFFEFFVIKILVSLFRLQFLFWGKYCDIAIQWGCVGGDMTEFGTNYQKRSPWKYNPVPSDCRSKCATLNLKSMVEAVNNYPEDFQIPPPTDQPLAPIIFLIFEFFANCPFVHSGSPSLQHWLIWRHQKCHAREERRSKKVVSRDN